MLVRTNSETNHVVLSGEGYEITLTWTQALNLGSLLVQKAEEAEPVPRSGRSYCPATERDRR